MYELIKKDGLAKRGRPVGSLYVYFIIQFSVLKYIFHTSFTILPHFFLNYLIHFPFSLNQYVFPPIDPSPVYNLPVFPA